MGTVTAPSLLDSKEVVTVPVYRFWVEIDSIFEAMFTECTGLNTERDVLELKEGGVNDHIHLLPGRTKYPHITLKHGFVIMPHFYNWYLEGLESCVVKRVTFSIHIFGLQNTHQATWEIRDAFPVKWIGPDLKTDGNVGAMEGIEIGHHGWTMRTRSGL